VAWPLAGAVALAIALYPLAFRGRLPTAWDVDAFFAPAWSFLASSLHHGVIPQWNPYPFGGAPFVGDPQSEALYPPALVSFWLLSPASGAIAWYAAHYLIAFAGTLRAGRNLGLSRPAATLGAVAYAASTYLVARAQAPTLLAGAAWLPVVLAAAVRTAGTRGEWLRPWLALAFAMQILAGSQQQLLVTAVACLAPALLRRDVRGLAWTAGSLALGALLSAPTLLPMLAVLAHTTAAKGVDASGFGSLGLADRALLAGSFSVTPSETAPLYVGVLGLGQALVALVSTRRTPRARLLTVWIALSLVWAVGMVGDVAPRMLPSLATITAHQPVRALPLALLALAIAAGSFWDVLAERRQVLLVLGVSAVGFALAGGSGTVSPWADLALAAATAGVLALALRPGWRQPAALLLLGVLALDLALHGARLQNTHQTPAAWQPAAARFPSPPPAAQELAKLGVRPGGPRFAWLAPHDVAAHELANANSALGRTLLMNGGATRYGLPSIIGYNPLVSDQLARAIAQANGQSAIDRHFVDVHRPAAPLLRAYGVRYYVCQASDCPAAMPVVWRGDGVQIVEDRSALPPARLSPDDGSALQPLQVSAGAASRSVTSKAPGAAGWLDVAESSWPGWHATVDGRRAPLDTGSTTLRVHVPAGWHEVRLDYAAPGLRRGLELAIVAWIALLAAAAAPRLRGRGAAHASVTA
jgi:hypothetical protein